MTSASAKSGSSTSTYPGRGRNRFEVLQVSRSTLIAQLMHNARAGRIDTLLKPSRLRRESSHPEGRGYYSLANSSAARPASMAAPASTGP
jgi:hypothetical protein